MRTLDILYCALPFVGFTSYHAEWFSQAQEMTSSQNELFVLQAVNRQGLVTIPLFIYFSP